MSQPEVPSMRDTPPAPSAHEPNDTATTSEAIPTSTPAAIITTAPTTVSTTTSTSENRLSLTLAGPGELLPRIAEEKDSPTNPENLAKSVVPTSPKDTKVNEKETKEKDNSKDKKQKKDAKS